MLILSYIAVALSILCCWSVAGVAAIITRGWRFSETTRLLLYDFAIALIVPCVICFYAGSMFFGFLFLVLCVGLMLFVIFISVAAVKVED